MMKLIKKKSIISILYAVLIVLFIWTIWGNTALEVNEYEITSNRIPETFSSFRIAQVSDLLNAEFGEGNSDLIGLDAPNQGFFPVYDAALFSEEITTMIVSRGVVNSIIPVRFNNRPEIIVVELERK